MARSEASQGLDLLRSDVRRSLYEHLTDLAADPTAPDRRAGLSAQELADVVGLHLTTVRFHLDQLVAAGLLTAVQAPPSGAGRPRKLYAVPSVPMSPPTDPEALRAYAALSEIVASADPRGEPLVQSPTALEQSGKDWARDHLSRVMLGISQDTPAATPGALLGKIGAVMDLLVGWGHAPELRTAAGGQEVDIVLRDCPFMSLAKDSPQLVCGVHRGLLRGALDALGEESVALDLQPLVDHHTCQAHLSITSPFPDRGESS